MIGKMTLVAALPLIVLVVVGLWSQAFKDNWLQWAGLWAMLAALVGIFWPYGFDVEDLGFIDAFKRRLDQITGPEMMLIYGMLLFELGTALKVIRQTPPGGKLRNLERRHWGHVKGGSK